MELTLGGWIMLNIKIIDYGIGNLLSVIRAFEYLDVRAELAKVPEELKYADAIILPGVGAFEKGMQGLVNSGFYETIIEYAKKGLPIMGICLGMQMLMDESYEFGVHKGLGLIPGKVVPIQSTTIDGEQHKIPHIGWNELILPEQKVEEWDKTILSGLTQRNSVYFIHSYTAMPIESRYRLADTLYGGRRLSAVIRNGNIYGCQFHPEKSGQVGIDILSNFINIAKK